MPERFGEPEHDSEYPEYSGAEGDGTDRFARPGKEPRTRGWRMKDSRVRSHTPEPSATPSPPLTSPFTAPQPDPAPRAEAESPASPYGAPPENPFGTPPTDRTATRTQKQKRKPRPARVNPDHVPANGYLAGAASRPAAVIKRRVSNALIGIGIVLVLILVSTLIRQCSSGGASANPGPGTGGGQPVVPAPADPTSLEEAIVEFDEFTVRGNSDHTFPLPDGVTNGVIDITYNGSGYIDVTANDQRGKYHETITWGSSSSGQFTATSMFGGYDYDGDYAAEIEVSARGDWQLTIRPLSTLAELPDTYSQDGESQAAFFYDGPGETVEIVLDAEPESYLYFRLDQATLIEYPENIVRLTRPATITTTLDPGPNIVVINPDGASSWSITKK